MNRTPDVVVVGDGLIGLASALALADAGHAVALVGADRPGQASHAAAGMLAPGVERAAAAVHAFAVRARDRYPDYVAALHERTGVVVPLNREGIIELALDDDRAAALRAGLGADARWLEPDELARLEPALAPAAGAAFYPDDGAVDNRRLLDALRHAVARHPRLARTAAPAVDVTPHPARPGVTLADGSGLQPAWLVLAAGAWTPLLRGLPRPLPIEPVRGQMLAVADVPLRHVVYGAGGYTVPRGDQTLLGSTMERTGFDVHVTTDGLERVHEVAAAICPALARAPEVERWAGLRPVTPDGLPILGPDPEHPHLVYACGHSRNGILLAALTGDAVAALVGGSAPPGDLAPFAVTRFATPPG
ncbi:MAG TPA: FAD-dependent oxidoreductase [Gemmatimonadaceae bacterium]|nr:FAD-dependent oxidoreductase [Gemmatimonadaceae bacterium]